MTEIKDKLTESIPRSEVRKRNQGGMTLDYVDGYYVYSQMCEVFGGGRWGYLVESLRPVAPYDGKTVTYEAVVKLWFGDDCRDYIMDVGHGHGHGKEGNAHESAAKEAVTDAVKRCCRVLGNRMGLALYDKDQRNVRSDDSILESIKKAKTISSLTKLRELVKKDGRAEVFSAYREKHEELKS